jgi:hypothetical protein
VNRDRDGWEMTNVSTSCTHEVVICRLPISLWLMLLMTIFSEGTWMRGSAGSRGS